MSKIKEILKDSIIKHYGIDTISTKMRILSNKDIEMEAMQKIWRIMF